MKQDARKNLASAQETEEAPCNEEIHGGEEIKGVGSVKIEDQGRHICWLYLSSHPHRGLKSSPALVTMPARSFINTPGVALRLD
jgi:hypothetical protein